MSNFIGISQNAKPGGPGCKGRVSRHNKGAGSKAKGKTFLYKSYLERAAWSFSKFVSSRKLRSDTACVKICTNDLYSGSHERHKRKGSLKCKHKRCLHKFKGDARTARYTCSFKQRRKNIVHPSPETCGVPFQT